MHLRTRRIFALPFFVFLAAVALSTPMAADETAKGDAEKKLERLNHQLLALANAERAKLKLPPLKLHSQLTDAAHWMAQDMADHDYFDHTDRKGRSIDPRLPDFGYQNYETLSENIAAGYPTPDKVVEDWMRSPGHRENLLDPNVREAGVGYAINTDSKFKHYWVLDFGSRFDACPVVINDESGETHTPGVKLTLYGEGWATRMRFSNDGQTWTAWEPFKAQREWTLTSGAGRHTVYVELSNGQNTRRSDDTVELAPDSMPVSAPITDRKGLKATP